MQVGMRDYNSLTQYQKPITIPEKEPLLDELKKHLSPEKQLDIKNNIDEKVNDYKETQQAQKDNTREFLAGYTGYQSKKNQVEIYLSVATNSDQTSSDDSAVAVLKNLRETQKQNDAVQGYATYKEFAQKVDDFINNLPSNDDKIELY